MPNPYVNKVLQADGTVLMDISDTTAVAADVVSGKTLYKADGAKVTGTASESVIGKRTGNPIVIPDGTAGAKFLHLGVKFGPMRAGSGTPSPDNPRVLSAYTGCTIYVSPTGNIQDAQAYAITFPPEAVFIAGGTLSIDQHGNVTATKTHYLVSYNGAESGWSQTTTGGNRYTKANPSAMDASVSRSGFYSSMHDSILSADTLINGPWGTLVISSGYIKFLDNGYAMTNLSGFKTWLGDMNSAGTPMQLCYPITTPVEYNCGTVSIDMLDGQNYVWTDLDGEMECLYYTSGGEDYRSDIEPVYQAKTNISPTASSQTITPDAGYDALSSVQINAMPSGAVTAPATITGSSASASLGTGGTSITLTKTVSVTPDVTTAGYISAGTAGNSDISLTATGTFSTTFVEGEFTTNSSTGVQSITIPYSGSGYPIMVSITPKGGNYGNATWKNAIQQYTVGLWSMTKSYMSTTPTYTTSGQANYGSINVTYKNSSSSSDSYARTGSIGNNTYTSSNPSNTATNCVKITGNKTMKVYVNTDGYGLLQSTDYSYYILYSA